MSGGTHAFCAMGCEVLVAGAAPRELRQIETLFRSYDQVFSRFIAGSELNWVNAAAGAVVPVSPLFGSVLETALALAEHTHGLVDPTVGAALVAAGYNRDFALIGDDPRPPAAAQPAGWRQVKSGGGLVQTGANIQLDLNGVVKALAVDAALALISAGGWVSAGGDLAASAPVEVALPEGGAVRLERGGLATSGSVKRRWLRGGRRQHHLIDPATGMPSSSPWRQVTVCGASCLEADVAAKACFLLGSAGPSWLAGRSLAGRFLSQQSETVTPAWRDAVQGVAACI
ncbi:MAG: FAD:protein transferase [Gaiellales bacterium]|nr:FAD:protein transferase [Gaiellales bacterium]